MERFTTTTLNRTIEHTIVEGLQKDIGSITIRGKERPKEAKIIKLLREQKNQAKIDLKRQVKTNKHLIT